MSFDAMLCDLAANSDRTTARVTAKSIEYPADRLRLAGVAWPWRPTTLFALASRWCRGRHSAESTMTQPRTANPLARRSLRVPALWGVVFGGIQAAAPLGFWWLDPATVYALSLS